MTEEQNYQTGFNNGYLLATHEPKLIQDITKTVVPGNDYLEGLIDGKEQLEIEKNEERLSEIDVLRQTEKNQDRGLEK